MTTFQRVSATVNKAVTPLLQLPGVNKVTGKAFTVLTYTGRKSGKQFQLPVNYRRDGDNSLTVFVALPDQKSWWRNFTGDGAPISVLLDGDQRSGHAVATRDDKGRVKVAITLD
ncbi:hypothetical protein GCM10027169_12220 [Gordonia jinhuaensis]|uniref:Deazaflavin-dependent oxidoreductase, nitroreductase family n=1 Tax=Gordonia jinhuaensis TaxID=1517702 RepID=A0A916T6B5_9ACTN|nr:nitroreductase/quinone reductase family protein [Gordonia jinhuaensis]GGB31896.1 hypothetical protein GCM10011489_20160 [Gordonia jinhuaensis]